MPKTYVENILNKTIKNNIIRYNERVQNTVDGVEMNNEGKIGVGRLKNKLFDYNT